MNPHERNSLSFKTLIYTCWFNRHLIMRLVKREVIGRYKGSVLGLGWSFFNPILMLSVYTFVFSVVFKARWGLEGDGDKVHFAIVLFVGMIIHGLFSEVINRAPDLIMSNASYVKKSIFPIEILPLVITISAVFHFMVNLIVFFAAFVLLNGFLHWTIIFIPLVILPLIILVLGISWIVSSLGVYLRDISQAVGIISMILLFLAPIFYPIDALPESYHFWILLNPITHIVEQTRDILVWGSLPDWKGLAIYLSMAVFVLWLGFAWFQKTRKGFADVL